ncbi:MAG: hypothetical protein NC393_01625 [Clostridium sp.]|nr:hypothetical protein [Clostridium sp.]MCM1208855.1 hypothetical protein [Ruminococcus sp.]
MSKANISILLVILSIAIVGGVYLYVYKPNMEEKDTIQAEVNTLQARYDDLAAKAQKKDQYLADTAMYRAEFEDEVAYFPATLDQEISVMFIKGINKDEGVKQFDVSNVGLGSPRLFYVLGSGAVAQGTTDVAYTEDSYLCYSAAFPVAYTGSYEGIKDLIDYVMAYKYRMNVSSVMMSYNSETDTFTGNVELNAYCVAGTDREADKVSVNVNNGVENIFQGGTGAVAVSSFEYDADNGAAIVSNHDVNILLNNANNDTSDGIIVSAGGSDTYVTSGANNVETLVITVDSEEGKNFVTYAIGDKSYKKEITSTDLKIYVESSKRVDGNDNNGVKVTVDNKTSLPVFFKVVDDDTTSPRFSVGSKSGTVKVY